MSSPHHKTRRLAAAVAAGALLLAPAVAEARIIKGTGQNDKLVGTASADTISGFNGNDRITARGGKDTVSGGTGNDIVYGNDGNDVLSGNADNDVLNGGAGDDQLNAGTGDDTLVGGAGDDNQLVNGKYQGLNGGDGNDRLSGGTGDDWVQGGNGNDVVDGGDGNDHPAGGPGVDRIFGGAGSDQLDGDDDDDFIDAGPGDDSCPGLVGAAVTNTCKGFPADPPKPDDLLGINVTGDKGDDIIYLGAGQDIGFGEEGSDLFVLYDDGVYDRIFCVDSHSDGNPVPIEGRVIYVDGVDPLDDIRNCPNADVPENLTAAQFMDDASLTYPNSATHLPLPTAVPQPTLRVRTDLVSRFF